jgi:hypothetical protein
MIEFVDYWMLQLRRYSMSIDRYMAEKSGNKELRAAVVAEIANIDREIDKLEINRD